MGGGLVKAAVEQEVRDLIRGGMKTSEIINKTGYPIEWIKAVKSQELEAQKKLDRDKGIDLQVSHMRRKREAAHKAFLKRMGQDPDKVEANETKQPEADNGAEGHGEPSTEGQTEGQ